MPQTTALRPLVFACLFLLAAAGAAAAPAEADSAATRADSAAVRTAASGSRADSAAVRTAASSTHADSAAVRTAASTTHADGVVSPPRPRGAGADTTRFLPRWVRPWLDFGGGWLSSPAWMHSGYESSQGFGVGLEARPHSRWALRAGLEYQMLQAKHDGNLVLVTTFGSTAFADTVPVHFTTAAWQVAFGGEFGVRTVGDLWLTGGGGLGYMRTGYEDVGGVTLPELQLAVPTALRSGFGPTWTAAARYDFEPARDVPLGLEVRTTVLRRGGDDVRLWLVRLCYRVPSRPPGPSPHPGGRRRR